ncbi:MAG: ankyrin repeat domain-containing protein [bacterium]|nr:ankyrin repeat domain-containing protein [bacterium]
MAHAPGWIELYETLEAGRTPSPELVAQCRHNKNGISETIVHWYAIEGTPEVLRGLIQLGFDVNTRDESGMSPIMSAAFIDRWDNVRVLRASGARMAGADSCGNTYRALLTNAGPAAPADLRSDAYDVEDLLLPNGPEEVEIYSVSLTRTGVAVNAPGAPFNEASFRTFYAGMLDEFELEDLEEDDPLLNSMFEIDDEIGPHIALNIVDLRERRRAYAMAQHFGLRVLWYFSCP